MARHSAISRSKITWLTFCLFITCCLAITFTQGCARSGIAHRSEAESDSPPAEQNLPFHQIPEHSTDESVHPSVPPDGKLPTGTPFRAVSHTRSLPAGSLMTVRLQDSLSISRAHTGDSFTASVAEPLAINGDTAIEAGTAVTGHVESVQPSVQRPGSTPDPGYLALSLDTISIDGRLINLQTSNLFATGTFRANEALGVSSSGRFNRLRIRKGRRLTFRITAAVPLPDTNAIAKR